MYISIVPQNLKSGGSKSVAGLVTYLEKEKDTYTQEHFFSQYEDHIPAGEVISGIDNNSSHIKKNHPHFYSIAVSPSSRELEHLENRSKALKVYTRELIKEYASCFNREINGRKIGVDDIKYYARIEHQRTYKLSDLQVKENQPYNKKIRKLKATLRRVERGEIPGDRAYLVKHIQKLEAYTPNKQTGKRIEIGMRKNGNQSHVHIIMSRKDMSNSVSLSPGSTYIASNVVFNGKLIKRGFGRDAFYQKAEKTFDSTFGYKRNFVESYQSRKNLIKDPTSYYKALLKLPDPEKALALKLLRERGISLPKISTTTARLGLQALKRGICLVKRSAAIEI